MRGVRGVRGARTVTDFAANAEFVGLNVIVLAQRERPGRMAGEAAQNTRYGIERAEDDAVFIAMAGGHGIAIEFAIPGAAFLAVRFAIDLRQKRDRAQPGAECPVARLPGDGRRESMSVPGFRLTGKVGSVAFAAGLRADVRRGGCMGGRGQEGQKYKRSGAVPDLLYFVPSSSIRRQSGRQDRRSAVHQDCWYFRSNRNRSR